MSPSVEQRVNHESGQWFESSYCPGVRFRIRRISLGNRIELATRIREAGRKLEFLEAGNTAIEHLEAAVLRGEIERIYLEWGLEELVGLDVDGCAANGQTLIDRGPLKLSEEIIGRIKAECGLTTSEQKN
jgi:hypothetical protein